MSITEQLYSIPASQAQEQLARPAHATDTGAHVRRVHCAPSSTTSLAQLNLCGPLLPKMLSTVQARFALRGYELTVTEEGFEVRNHISQVVLRQWSHVAYVIDQLEGMHVRN